jgi:S-adenosylmethionine hydrolase
MSARPLVLFTDFGGTDFYAGVTRAVLASASPASRVIDLQHDLPAHDVDAASFVLARAFEYLPRDAVVVAVIDPGVGTARRGLVLTLGERTLVGPDNGFASDLLLSAGATEAHGVSFVGIDERAAQRETGVAARGSTFHGRDIFGPVAAAIARGASAAVFGENVDGIIMLRDVPSASVDSDTIHARGRYVDHFGNVLTDIPAALVRRVFEDPAGVEVMVGGRAAGTLQQTYAPGERGALMALINSWGLVEAAMNGGRAIDFLANAPAAAIRFELRRAR